MIGIPAEVLGVKRSKPFAFRPEGETEHVIRDAVNATGLSVTVILNRCVARALPEVVHEAEQERQRAAAKFMKDHPPGKKKG
jgi:hypothetical protein